MKELHLKVSDEVLKELRTLSVLKGISGNAYGIHDETINRIVKALEDGDTELVLELKSEVENDATD